MLFKHGKKNLYAIFMSVPVPLLPMIKDKQDSYLDSDAPKWLGFAAWWTFAATVMAWIWFHSAS
jgi:hypothetical protein